MEFAKFKPLSFVITLIYFTVGYTAINWIVSFRGATYDVMFQSEQQIPFVPIFIIGYLLVYVTAIGLYFLVKDEALYKRSIYAFLLLTTLHYAFFLIIPVKMILRPEIAISSEFMSEFVRLYYLIDRPQNCFPSLHVAYTFLGVLILWGYKRLWAYVYILCTIIVCFSVLFVKQHYIMDIVGGLITPVIVYFVVSRNPTK